MTTNTVLSVAVAALFVAAAHAFVAPLSTQTSVRTKLSAQSSSDDMMPLRRGSTCALFTPFTDKGDIDVPGLEKLLHMHLEKGTDNLCVLGTTAEASTMSMAERELVLKKVVSIVKGKIPIMVGTGTINPNSIMDMTQQAIDLGADANLLVSPYYVKPPQRALARLFTQTADKGLPVVIYNVPGRTMVDVTDETILLCAQHENIVALKDATGDLKRLDSLLSKLENRDDLLLFSGDDGSTLDFVLGGGDGCISVTANLVPGVMKDIMHAALNGNDKEAKLLNAPLLDLHDKLFVESNPIPCKWAAMKTGMIDSAYCRPPLDTMDPSYESSVEAALQAAGLLEPVVVK